MPDHCGGGVPSMAYLIRALRKRKILGIQGEGTVSPIPSAPPDGQRTDVRRPLGELLNVMRLALLTGEGMKHAEAAKESPA